MTPQEKYFALRSIARHIDITARFDPHTWKDDDWRCSTGLEEKNDDLLTSLNGRGGTPEEAIEDVWQRCTEAAIVVYSAHGDNRQQYCWNGRSWEVLP